MGENNLAIGTSDEYKTWKIDIPADMETEMGTKLCMYKVPPPLRGINEAAYTPQVISIGPVHYGNLKLSDMELQKLRYLENFRKRLRSEERESFVNSICKFIKKCEKMTRRYYSKVNLCSDKFVTMLFLDSVFIFELFLRNHRRNQAREEERNIVEHHRSVDFIIGHPWLETAVQLDLILLENQLPYQVLKTLYETATKKFENGEPGSAFDDLSYEYFKGYNPREIKPADNQSEPLHFTDLVRKFYIFKFPEDEQNKKNPSTNASLPRNSASGNPTTNSANENLPTNSSSTNSANENLSTNSFSTRLLYGCCLLGRMLHCIPKKNKKITENRYSVTKLREGGVEFTENLPTNASSGRNSANQNPPRNSCSTTNSANANPSTNSSSCVFDLLGGMPHFIRKKNKIITENFYSVTKLREGGVKFKLRDDGGFLGINFEKKSFCPCCTCTNRLRRAELQIPCFKVDDKTERVIRNVMALEQCHYPRETYICNYIILLDSLIDTEQDVELLVERGIIEFKLGENRAVAEMVNKLSLQITEVNKVYSSLTQSLNAHYESGCNQNIAYLRSVYFSNVWRGTGTCVAILLVVLTVVQAICSILALQQL